MKNIIIIGNSPAAHAAVKAVLDRDPSAAVTLISCDGHLPYDRMLLPGLIDRSVMEKNIYGAPADFYAAAQVQVVLDKEVSRINFDRKRVFLADVPVEGKASGGKAHADYDGLIIADLTQTRLPALKGIRRQGVFHLARLESVKNLIRYLSFTETVLIEPSGFSGIRAALALKAAGKDVIVAARHDMLLPDILTPDRSAMLARALAVRGVRVLPSGGGVADIIGEAEVKAVRFCSGKVVACDMVVLADVSPDLRFLEDTALAMAGRIPVTGTFRTNLPDVYAIDAVCQSDMPKFTGGYGMDTAVGCVQAWTVVAGLWGEDKMVAEADLVPRDMLDDFFHPQELLPLSPEDPS